MAKRKTRGHGLSKTLGRTVTKLGKSVLDETMTAGRGLSEKKKQSSGSTRRPSDWSNH